MLLIGTAQAIRAGAKKATLGIADKVHTVGRESMIVDNQALIVDIAFNAIALNQLRQFGRGQFPPAVRQPGKDIPRQREERVVLAIGTAVVPPVKGRGRSKFQRKKFLRLETQGPHLLDQFRERRITSPARGIIRRGHDLFQQEDPLAQAQKWSFSALLHTIAHQGMIKEREELAQQERQADRVDLLRLYR